VSLRIDGALLSNRDTQAGCDSVVYQLSFYYLTIAYSLSAFGCVVGILRYCFCTHEETHEERRDKQKGKVAMLACTFLGAMVVSKWLARRSERGGPTCCAFSL